MKKGFSLIETIIAIAILLIVIVGIVGVLQANIRMAGRTGGRVGAVSLVNKRMEMLRNLAYNDVGTIGGIPDGPIPQEEIITLNNIEYTLKTFIQYVDDPADGFGTDDENGITTDYKRTRLEVSWSGRYAATPVVAVSDFMPKGIETVIGGGTLIINIFNASVQPVNQANIYIVNNDVEPAVDINVQTNDQGRVVFPGAPSVGKYQVTVTKAGYSTAQTYDAIPENPSPNPGHLTILEGETTEATFFIDLISSLNVQTLASESVPLGDVSFDMTGAKTIGTDGEGQPIPKYSESHLTNINGYLTIEDLEWDLYDISDTKINGQLYDISASSPSSPINIEPDTANSLKLFLFPHASNTLLVTVEDALGGLIISASVRLFRAGYNQTIETGETGQSFFTPLQAGTDYSLEVTKPGYQNYSLENVEISGQTEVSVIMATP